MKHHTKCDSYLPKCYIHITNDVIAISMPAALRVDDMYTAIIRITHHDVIAVSMPAALRVASRLVYHIKLPMLHTME